MKTLASDNLPYRPCVGVALFNQDGKIFLGKRTVDLGSWAMPQSGIQQDETVMLAARRELAESLGITSNIRMLSVAPEWFSFDFPAYLISRIHNGEFHGQIQKWVAAHYLGSDSDINVLSGGKNEFSSWKWENFSRISSLVVPYKRQLYKNIYEAFKIYAQPISTPVREIAVASIDKTQKETSKNGLELSSSNIVHIHQERQRRVS